jgi:acetyl esterase/lipase
VQARGVLAHLWTDENGGATALGGYASVLGGHTWILGGRWVLAAGLGVQYIHYQVGGLGPARVLPAAHTTLGVAFLPLPCPPLPPRRILAAVTPALRGWLLALLCSLLVALPPAERALRASALLLRLGASAPPSGLATYRHVAVSEEPGELRTGRGSVRTRVYRPAGEANAPALVLLHGLHRLGVDEPRLQGFARALASSGVLVHTPEVAELTDYRVEPSAVETIGRAAIQAGEIAGRSQVGVMGFSFAGGLALLAAADPRYRGSIAFTVSVGGHHDLERIARFFVEDRIPTAEGGELAMKAHDYGLLVLLYGATGDFFSGEDTGAAHEALRLWLANDRDRARKAAEGLSPPGKAKMERIFAERGAELAGEVKATLGKQKAGMAAVSPAGKLGAVSGGVYLLHGSDDRVIPPSEALWLAREVPASRLKAVLVSPAVQHVELQGKPSWLEQARVVAFMASLLDEAEREPR